LFAHCIALPQGKATRQQLRLLALFVFRDLPFTDPKEEK